MHNDVADVVDPERALMLSYVPRDRRRAVAALWALDERFGVVIATTSEPMVGAIRVAWWREALATLDHAPPPPEPLLREIAAALLPAGVAGTALADLADGWTALLETPIGADALAAHAEERGGRLFGIAAHLLGIGAGAWISAAGEGWALADVAHRSSDPAVAAAARREAAVRLRPLRTRFWPRAERPLAMLAVLAARDATVTSRRQASPARLARMIRLRITGR